MKIIEVLKREVPKNMRRRARIDAQYELTKELMSDIDEARSYGYSWTQICKAVKEAETANGKWQEDWNIWHIERNYRQIKKEGAASNGI